MHVTSFDDEFERLRQESIEKDKIIEELMDRAAEDDALISQLKLGNQALQNLSSSSLAPTSQPRKSLNQQKESEEKFQRFTIEYESFMCKYHGLVKKAKRLEKQVEALKEKRFIDPIENQENIIQNDNLKENNISVTDIKPKEHLRPLRPALTGPFKEALASLPLDTLHSLLHEIE